MSTETTRVDSRNCSVESIVSACCCLHNIRYIQYPGNPPVDRDNANYDIIPGEWRDNADLTELKEAEMECGYQCCKGTETVSQEILFFRSWLSTMAE